MGIAIETRIPTMETTIRISISVKPRRLTKAASPLRVWRSIASLLVAGSVNIEHILTAPGSGFRIVLHAALAPFARVGHRIERNSAQKFYFLVRLVGDLHAFHQNLQSLRITLGTDFERTEFVLVGMIFILIDGVPDLVQG